MIKESPELKKSFTNHEQISHQFLTSNVMVSQVSKSSIIPSKIENVYVSKMNILSEIYELENQNDTIQQFKIKLHELQKQLSHLNSLKKDNLKESLIKGKQQEDFTWLRQFDQVEEIAKKRENQIQKIKLKNADLQQQLRKEIQNNEFLNKKLQMQQQCNRKYYQDRNRSSLGNSIIKNTEMFSQGKSFISHIKINDEINKNQRQSYPNQVNKTILNENLYQSQGLQNHEIQNLSRRNERLKNKNTRYKDQIQRLNAIFDKKYPQQSYLILLQNEQLKKKLHQAQSRIKLIEKQLNMKKYETSLIKQIKQNGCTKNKHHQMLNLERLPPTQLYDPRKLFDEPENTLKSKQKIQAFQYEYKQSYTKIIQDETNRYERLVELALQLATRQQPNLVEFSQWLQYRLQAIYIQIAHDLETVKLKSEQCKNILSFAYSSIANLRLQQLKPWQKIQVWLQKALSIYNSNLSIYYEQKISLLNNLAIYYNRMDKFLDTVCTYKEILQIQEKYFSRNDDRAILTRSNLACFCLSLPQIALKILNDCLNAVHKDSPIYKQIRNNFQFYNPRSEKSYKNKI